MSISFSLKKISVAIASAVLVLSNAHAAGLGKLTVLSSLGQPLRAEIELNSVSKDDAGALVAKLASADAFRQANIELNSMLMSLRFAIEQRGGQQLIRVTSVQPINEPFIDMLLELAWTNGRLVREYTFLLDPAELRRTQSAQVSAPVSAPAAIAPSSATLPITAADQPAPADNATQRVANKSERRLAAAKPVPPAKAASQAAAKSGDYQVRKGDTLAHIAAQVKPEGVSLDQMLVALYRANPNAFNGKNMNRLRAGQILSMPEGDVASVLSKADAKGVVLAQATDFSNYRNTLAGQVARIAPKKPEEAKQSAVGKITTKVEEQPTAANESKDKLKLSKASATAATGAVTDKATAAKAVEDKIANDKAVADANQRVRDLEKNVNDLQKALEIKNKGLAEQQSKAEAAKPAAPAALAAAAVASASSPAALPANDKSAEAQTAASTAASASATASASVVPAPTPAKIASAAAVAKPKPKLVPAPQPEPSFFDSLLDNPFLLPGAGILLAALGGLGIYSARRKKSLPQHFDESTIANSSLKANSLFGSIGGQSVDTNNSVFNSNFAPSASQLDANEVDPVAEADVYIAYGRDAQAEEILKEALRTQPERNAVRVKLLEIYAQRKDLRSFEMLASELYGMTKGEGDDWAQAASLGVAIDPNNPLYAGGDLPEEVAAKAVSLSAPTQPLEELDPEMLLASAQPQGTATSDNLLEFDNFGFDSGAASSDAEAAAPALPELNLDHDVQQAVSDGLDFDLGAPQESAVMVAPAQEASVQELADTKVPEEIALNFDAIDFDFIKPAEVTVEAESDAVVASVAAVIAPQPVEEGLSLQFDTLEFDAAPVVDAAPAVAITPIVEPAVTSVPEPLEFDLSGINLDFSPMDGDHALVQEHQANLDTPTHAAASGNVEMATKLDLAVAYQEIGDKEGARELLDEVIKGGTAEQSEKAKTMLAKLA